MSALNAASSSAAFSGDTKEFVTVHIADQLFGVAVVDIHDVFALQAVTPVPLSPPEVAGVLNLRGRIVTAIDARVRLGLPARAEGLKGAMALGVERDGEAFGLVIDSVGEVLQLADSAFEHNPVNLDPKWRAVSRGVYRLQGKLLMVLDVDRMLDVGLNNTAGKAA
jgi:purine-binding chemotaxis protein CheW